MTDLAALLRPRPWTQQTTGVVLAVRAGTATTATTVDVNIGGQVCTQVPCLAGVDPVSGDVALLLASDRRVYVIGTLCRPLDPPDPPTPPPQATTGTTVFPAVAAGTYLDLVWRTDRTDVIQGPETDGAMNMGVWTYAGIPAGTLAGRTVTSARVWVHRWPPAGAPVDIGLCLHDQARAPSAPPPTILDTATLVGVPPGWAGWVLLDPTWAADIIDPGSPVQGIGVHTADPADYAALASTYTDAQSGALSITWEE